MSLVIYVDKLGQQTLPTVDLTADLYCPWGIAGRRNMILWKELVHEPGSVECGDLCSLPSLKVHKATFGLRTSVPVGGSSITCAESLAVLSNIHTTILSS
jgi:hypothetical protein